MDKCTFIIFPPLCLPPNPFFPNKSLSVFKSLCDLLNLIRIAYVSGGGDFSKDNLPMPIPLRRVTTPSPGASNTDLPETLLLEYRKILIDNFHGNIYDPAQNGERCIMG